MARPAMVGVVPSMVVLVLTLDTSTPVVTAGIVDLLRPHELAGQGGVTEAGGRVDASVTTWGESGQQEDAHDGAPAAARPARLRPWRTLAEKSVVDAFGHAENLMPLAAAALDEVGAALRDIDAVVVGIGPGPFTGLRVGIATAAALGDALGIPVHGVASHDAVAGDLADTRRTGAFLVATDARRREVYVSSYDAQGRRIHGPDVLSPAALPELLAEHGIAPTCVAGAGAEIAASALGLPTVQSVGPWSGGAVACAARALLTGAVPGPIEPLYLRRPDAAEPHRPKAALPVAGSQGEPGVAR